MGQRGFSSFYRPGRERSTVILTQRPTELTFGWLRALSLLLSQFQGCDEGSSISGLSFKVSSQAKGHVEFALAVVNAAACAVNLRQMHADLGDRWERASPPSR